MEENELVNLVSLLNVKLIDQAREFNLKENQPVLRDRISDPSIDFRLTNDGIGIVKFYDTYP